MHPGSQPAPSPDDGAVAGEPVAAIGARPLSARRIAVGLLVGLPVSALFLWLAARGIEAGDLGRAVAGAAPGWIALTVGLMAVLYACQAERWRIVGASEAWLPRRQVAAMVVGGVAANNLVPGRPGEPLRAYWFSRSAGLPFGRGLATVVVDRSFDLLVLVGLLVGTLAFVPSPTWVERLTAAGLVLAGGLALALALIWRARRRSPRPARRSGGPLARVIDQSLQFIDALARCLDGVRALRAILLSAGAYGCFAVGAWAIGRSLGLELSLLAALFITAALNLGSAIPSSPGFVGTYQWLAVAGLGLFAVSATDAFAFAVLLQATWFVPTTLAGLALAARAGATWRPRRLLSAPAPPAPELR